MGDVFVWCRRRSAATVVLATVAALALAAACSGGDDVVELDESSPSSSSSSTATTGVPTTSSTAAPTSATTPPSGQEAEDAVILTWLDLLNAARSGAPDDEQLATIESLAGPETVEQLLAPLFPESSAREIEFFPALTPGDDGTYAIDDCLVMNRGISTGVSSWFVGTAEPDGESPTGWRVTEIRVVDLDPCVPRSIADAAIAGYEAYWNAFDQIFDPPDPDSALIDETTSDPYREFVVGLAADLAAEGQLLRGRPDTMPEFSVIRSTTEVVIIDCQDVNPELGVYVAATGERTDLVEPVEQGELDLQEATMKLEGGEWKVSDLQGAGDVQCRTPPTPETLRIAGG